MCPLPSVEKRLLLEVARRSLIQAVQVRSILQEPDLPSHARSSLSAGAFVTLRRKSRLRGCIGQVGVPQPIVPLVAYCAQAAALQDPRFAPVEPHEVPEIEIELSILSAPDEITLEHIEIGKHGLMVTRGKFRGLLLPQVAVQYGWHASRFLEETCVKAGLERTAWKAADVRLEGFTAEVFCESEFSLRVPVCPGAND